MKLLLTRIMKTLLSLFLSLISPGAQELTREEFKELIKNLPPEKRQILDDEFLVNNDNEAMVIANKFIGKKYGLRDVSIGIKDAYLSSLPFSIKELASSNEKLWCVETFHLAGIMPVDVAYVNPKTEECVVVYGYSMKADFKRKLLAGDDLMKEPVIDNTTDPVEIDPEKYVVNSSAAAIEIAYPLFMKSDDADAAKDKAIRAYPIDAPAGIEDFCEDKELVWCVEIGIPGKARKISAVAYVHPQTGKCVFVYAKHLKLPNP